MSVLLASRKMQADTAGLTGGNVGVGPVVGPTHVESIMALVHGESGTLGYLWDNVVPLPVHTALPARPLAGPHGGVSHPDVAGGAGGAPLGATYPSTTVPNVAAPPPGGASFQQSPTPNENIAVAAARTITDDARRGLERLRGLFR